MSGIVQKVKNALGGSQETNDGTAAHTTSDATHPQTQGGVVGKVKHAIGADHTSQPTHGTTTSPGIAGSGATTAPQVTPTTGSGVGTGVGSGAAGVGSGVGTGVGGGVHTGTTPHVGGVHTHVVGHDPIRGPGAHGTGHTSHNHAIDPVIGAGSGTPAGGVGTGVGHHGVGSSPAVGTTGAHGIGAGHHGQTVGTPSVGGTTGPHANNPQTHHGPGGIVEKAKAAVGVGHHKTGTDTAHSPGLVDKAKHLVGADKGHQSNVPGSAAGMGHAGATGVNSTGATTATTPAPGTGTF